MIFVMGVLIVLFARCESEVLYYDPGINVKYNLVGTLRSAFLPPACQPSACYDSTYEENVPVAVKRIAKHKLEIYGLFLGSRYPDPVVATLNGNSFEFSLGGLCCLRQVAQAA